MALSPALFRLSAIGSAPPRAFSRSFIVTETIIEGLEADSQRPSRLVLTLSMVVEGREDQALLDLGERGSHPDMQVGPREGSHP
jgi:hypothetical protein